MAGIRDFSQPASPTCAHRAPGADGAALEGKRDFAKEFMTEMGIPTAAYRSFTAETLAEGEQFLATLNPPYVLKADGSCRRKGSTHPSHPSKRPRRRSARCFRVCLAARAPQVVIEEFLSGIECSVICAHRRSWRLQGATRGQGLQAYRRR